MSDVRTYSLTLPSDRSSIAAVEPFVASIESVRLLDEQRYYNMLVALTEAVNNAIIHGNGADPTKMVELQVQTSSSEVIFLVNDSGAGFDPEDVPDPRQPDMLLRDGGRGVFLIRHLADVVEFFPTTSGTTVLIKFFLL
ncbi:MAG: ATP-binding protein [Bacteroidetes bacterium]|nr:ATP-binding protein [Bacteroidota bacterium]